MTGVSRCGSNPRCRRHLRTARNQPPIQASPARASPACGRNWRRRCAIATPPGHRPPGHPTGCRRRTGRPWNRCGNAMPRYARKKPPMPASRDRWPGRSPISISAVRMAGNTRLADRFQSPFVRLPATRPRRVGLAASWPRPHWRRPTLRPLTLPRHPAPTDSGRRNPVKSGKTDPAAAIAAGRWTRMPEASRGNSRRPGLMTFTCPNRLDISTRDSRSGSRRPARAAARRVGMAAQYSAARQAGPR